LLKYPNPDDPLNSEAARLLLKSPLEYKKKVHDYVIRYAKGNEFLTLKPKKKFKIKNRVKINLLNSKNGSDEK